MSRLKSFFVILCLICSFSASAAQFTVRVEFNQLISTGATSAVTQWFVNGAQVGNTESKSLASGFDSRSLLLNDGDTVLFRLTLTNSAGSVAFEKAGIATVTTGLPLDPVLSEMQFTPQ